MAEHKEVKQVSVRLEMPIYNLLTECAKEEHRTLHNMVMCIIMDYLKSKNKNI